MDYGVRLRGQLIDLAEKFKYLGTVVKENEGIIIADDVAGTVRCGWVKCSGRRSIFHDEMEYN